MGRHGQGPDLRKAKWATPSTAIHVPDPVPVRIDPAPRSYRRAETTPEADGDGFIWVNPSASVWPNVRGNPPGPRTQVIGYNKEQRVVRTVFRDGTQWRYDTVPPDVWERVRRTASTGRFIIRVLDGYPYGPDRFDPPQ